jgi:hypothetical protein
MVLQKISQKLSTPPKKEAASFTLKTLNESLKPPFRLSLECFSLGNFFILFNQKVILPRKTGHEVKRIYR